jgi:hypothetical protein
MALNDAPPATVRTVIAKEYKVVALRECPLPESMQLCDTPQSAADYWRNSRILLMLKRELLVFSSGIHHSKLTVLQKGPRFASTVRQRAVISELQNSAYVRHRFARPFDYVAQINLKTGGQPYRRFKRGLAEAALDVANHLFGEPGAQSDCIFRKTSAFPLLPKQADNLDADRMMRFIGHHITFL